MRSNAADISARTVGSSTPSSAWNTTEPPQPAPKPPKFSSRMSLPRLDSTSGSSNSERVSVPTADRVVKPMISVASQATTTIQRRRYDQRPRRANTGSLHGARG